MDKNEFLELIGTERCFVFFQDLSTNYGSIVTSQLKKVTDKYTNILPIKTVDYLILTDEVKDMLNLIDGNNISFFVNQQIKGNISLYKDETTIYEELLACSYYDDMPYNPMIEVSKEKMDSN